MRQTIKTLDINMLRVPIRYASTSQRPPLINIIPRKKILNRILFDQDSRLTYKKVMQTYDCIYQNLDSPQDIKLPSYIRSDDLMVLKDVLGVIRKTTNTINSNLVAIENELVEQASELGNNDAISMLAFKTIQDKNTTKEDYKYATKLIDDLSKLKHPLTFKLAGDLAFSKGALEQAKDYWLEFIELEPNTINASHVYSNLGIYFYTQYPKPDLYKARYYLEKSMALGQLDSVILRSHYYYSQLFTLTNPKLAKYHLEICASKGLKESFNSLGFMEMNVFNNYPKSLEWFKLGVEADGDLSCLIGQFDLYILLKDYKNANRILQKIKSIQEMILQAQSKTNAQPEHIQRTIASNGSLLNMFFGSRQELIKLASNLAF